MEPTVATSLSPDAIKVLTLVWQRANFPRATHVEENGTPISEIPACSCLGKLEAVNAVLELVGAGIAVFNDADEESLHMWAGEAVGRGGAGRDGYIQITASGRALASSLKLRWPA